MRKFGSESGIFVLGALVATVWRRARTPNWLKVGLGTGTVGSFTTFSALIISLIAQAHNGLWMLAVLYLVMSLVLGFGAALLGLSLGRHPRPTPLAIDMVNE